MIPGMSVDQEALLITLTRPIVLAHPIAFDKGRFRFNNHIAFDIIKDKKYACSYSMHDYINQIS